MNIAEDLEQGRRDALFVDANREAFLAEYPERWIAVLDERVVATNANFRNLLAEIDILGVSRETVYLEFLTADDTALVLNVG
jgi:hypothetical protein